MLIFVLILLALAGDTRGRVDVLPDGKKIVVKDEYVNVRVDPTVMIIIDKIVTKMV